MHRSLMMAAAATLIPFFEATTAFAQLGIHATAESAVSGWRRMESRGNAVWVSAAPSLTSSDLETAYLNTGPDGRNRITLVFNEAGTEKMCEFSVANFGRPVAILLDGTLISMPTIRSAVGKEAAIDGLGVDFGQNELQRILATIDRKPQAPSEPRCVRIHGRMTQQPNDAESSSILLRPNGGVYSSTTNVKSDGSFEFPMVPPGTYTLEPTWNGMRMPPPYSSITVTDKALVGVELTIPKMKNVLGSVTVEGDGPMPPLQFQISEGSWSAGILSFPKPDGSFSITLPEGERRFGLLAIFVVTDFDRASWQDVLEETVEELVSGQRHVPNLLGAIVAVSETDLAVVDRFQAAVRDGDTKDVAAQIVEDLFAAPCRLTVNDPFRRPD